VICFVSNGAWIEGNSTDGFRKSLEKEFSSIWVFNLRGNQRTSGELSRKEGGKIFGIGSRTPISITLLVKNPTASNKKALIKYHDIGDYLSREEKLTMVRKFQSVSNAEMEWHKLQPNEHGDWIKQRNDVFDTFIPMAPEKKFNTTSQSFFTTYAIGVATNRDSWALNFSKKEVETNIERMVNFYNNEVNRFHYSLIENPNIKFEDFINNDSKKIRWTAILKIRAKKKEFIAYDKHSLRISAYRPFTKSNLYFNRYLNEAIGLSPKLFPTSDHRNTSICITGISASKDFSALITDNITNLDALEKAQCFPLYYYEEREKDNPSIFDTAAESEYIRRDGVSDFILVRAKQQYGKNVTKEDVFYYVYGFLHSKEYRETFANDLKKMLPRLPLVEDVKNFWAFSKAGRKLAELHINYEEVPPYDGVEISGDSTGFFRVEKMRFPKKKQKETIIYNSRIQISNIPAKAYEYVVNGKSAIEWIMERYQVTVDKASGIKNDPNDWADEVGNPRYILDLLLSIINVSVQTVDIVNGLPKLDFNMDEPTL
jgi:predicted helicase